MPSVRPISDLQRNMGSVAEECHVTKKPVYLTKNGASSLVIQDAEAYEQEHELLAVVREREERVARSLIRGFDDIANGRVRTLEEARRDAARIREAMESRSA